jgi:hypothetical protein
MRESYVHESCLVDTWVSSGRVGFVDLSAVRRCSNLCCAATRCNALRCNALCCNNLAALQQAGCAATKWLRCDALCSAATRSAVLQGPFSWGPTVGGEGVRSLKALARQPAASVDPDTLARMEQAQNPEPLNP